MHVDPDFPRQFRDARHHERFSPSESGSGLRPTLLGFGLLLAALLGAAILAPPSLATRLVANTLSAAP